MSSSAVLQEGRLRRVVQRSLLVLVGVALALGLAELTLRLALGARAGEQAAELARGREQALQLLARPPGEAQSGMFRNHPYYGYTLKPGFDGRSAWGWKITTDRHGFRNDFDFEALPEGTRVIGLFGGSAAFGWAIDGNENTLAPRLEEALHERGAAPEVRVVSLALPAWHYPQQYIAFSRLAERLDAVVVFEGWNELFVPLSNAFDYDARLPPDFPWSPFYSTFVNAGGAAETFETYARLQRASQYDPHGWAAHFALYNWLRYSQDEAARQRAAAGLKTRPDFDLFPGEQRFADTSAGYSEAVDFGVGEYVKYARLLDGVASAYGVPVLHVIQPFRCADRALSVTLDDAPNFARVLFREGHPGEVYGRLRERAVETYRELASDGPVQLVDLAESLPPGTGSWIDVIHPSVEGVQRTADRLADELAARGFLERLRPR